jgi:uracil-DNA glycosylase
VNLLPELPVSWVDALDERFIHTSLGSLNSLLLLEREHYTILPPENEIFNAFSLTSFDNVKVVILGQDPYHAVGQAHGLAFSVSENIVIPPSLKNIFKELADDIDCGVLKSGDLSSWATQGVLLLNTLLSVRAGEPLSHKDKGWEEFTDEVIRTISMQKEHVVFILWGAPAQKKAVLIDESRHLILRAPHPSPLSSYRGFFGSKPFSRTNAYLVDQGIEPIQWCSLN